MTAATIMATNATGDIDVSFPLDGCLRRANMRRGHAAEKQFRKRPKTIRNQFRAGDGFNALMTGNGETDGIVLPLDSGGHLHTFITLCVPYALRMQPYAPIMHFFVKIEKPIKSKAERTSGKPYALYAPLFGVGPF